MTVRWVNRDAVEWVMFDAEVPGEQFPVMVTVAAFADAQGRGSYPARSLIARVARRSLRQVARDLATLIKGGHLIEGDWHLVMHIRSDRRPKVYDLPDPYRMWLSRRVTVSPRKAPRGDKNDVHGVTNTTERGDTVAHKEFLKNSGKRGRGAQPSAAPPAANCKACHVGLDHPYHRNVCMACETCGAEYNPGTLGAAEHLCEACYRDSAA